MKWFNFDKKNELGPNFGISLTELVARDQAVRPGIKVPLALTNIIESLEIPENLEKEGILRMAGSVKTVKMVREALDKDAMLDLKTYDAFSIGDLLKQFMRAIPNGLIPDSLSTKFMIGSDKLELLTEAVDDLEDANYFSLKRILGLCRDIAAKKELNKMSWPNLTLVLTPNVFNGEGISDTMRMSTAIHSMLLHFEEIFDDTDDEDGVKDDITKKTEEVTQKIEEKNEDVTSGDEVSRESRSTSISSGAGNIQSVLDELQQTINDGPAPAKDILFAVKRRQSVDQAAVNIMPIESESALSPFERRRAESTPAPVSDHIILPAPSSVKRSRSTEPPSAPDAALVGGLLPSLTKSRPPPPGKLKLETQMEILPDNGATTPRSILKSSMGSIGSIANSPAKSVKFHIPPLVESGGESDANDASESEKAHVEDSSDAAETSDDSEEFENEVALADDEVVVHSDEDDIQPSLPSSPMKRRMPTNIPAQMETEMGRRESASKLAQKSLGSANSARDSIISNQASRIENIEKLLETPVTQSVDVKSPAVAKKNSIPSASAAVVFQVAKAKQKFANSLKMVTSRAGSISSPSRDEGVEIATPLSAAVPSKAESPVRPERDPPARLHVDTGVQKSAPIPASPVEDPSPPQLPYLPNPPVSSTLLIPLLQAATTKLRDYDSYLKFVKSQVREMPDGAERQAASMYYKTEKEILSSHVEKYRMLKTYLQEDGGTPLDIQSVSQPSTPKSAKSSRDQTPKENSDRVPASRPIAPVFGLPSTTSSKPKTMKKMADVVQAIIPGPSKDDLLREKHMLKKEIMRLKKELLNATPSQKQTHEENLQDYHARYQELRAMLGTE